MKNVEMVLTDSDYKISHNDAQSKLVTDEGNSKNPETFEQVLEEKRHLLDKSTTESIINEWREQQSADRKLRQKYSNWLLGVFLAQILTFTAIFWLASFKIVVIETSQLTYWLGALVIEIIGLVSIIATGLFKNTTEELYKLISSLTNSVKNNRKD